MRQVLKVLTIGAILATVFTAWMPIGIIANALGGRVEPAPIEFTPFDDSGFPTPTARPRPRIGLVAGHWGNDSGAVCGDGLTEAEVNLTIATLVKGYLVERDFDVDLLREFDAALAGYRALLLISIHADSCNYINDQATGFKVAAAVSSTDTDRAVRLQACLRARYGESTSLPFHSGSITADMTSYHAFEEIHYETPAVIIETGFLNLDRPLLTGDPEIVAEGILNGILCYIYNEDLGSNE